MCIALCGQRLLRSLSSSTVGELPPAMQLIVVHVILPFAQVFCLCAYWLGASWLGVYLARCLVVNLPAIVIVVDNLHLVDAVLFIHLDVVVDGHAPIVC